MKKKLCADGLFLVGKSIAVKTLFFSLFSGFVVVGYAAEPGPLVFQLTAAPAIQEGVEMQTDRLPFGKAARQLAGRKIRDSQGKSAGKLEEMIIDLETGHALVGLFTGGKGYCVVPSAVFETAFEDRLELKVTRQQLEAAPRVGDVNGACDQKVIQNAYVAFGKPVPPIKALRPSRQFSGKNVISSDGESLGVVRDLVLDLAAGRIIYVVIDPVVGQNPRESLYVAPGRAFTWNERGGLTLKATTQHFLASRVVSRQFPTEMVMPELAKAIYSHYPAPAN